MPPDGLIATGRFRGAANLIIADFPLHTFDLREMRELLVPRGVIYPPTR
jgi:hypothetical protein